MGDSINEIVEDMLVLACRHGEVSIAERLLCHRNRRDYDVRNIRGGTNRESMEEAITNDHVKIVNLLLEHTTVNRCNSLIWASVYNKHESVDAILTHGVQDDEIVHALVSASYDGHLKIVKTILKRCTNVDTRWAHGVALLQGHFRVAAELALTRLLSKGRRV